MQLGRVIGTATASAEIETSGMTINYVPRDGVNSYALTFQGSGTSGGLQANNLDSAIKVFLAAYGRKQA